MMLYRCVGSRLVLGVAEHWVLQNGYVIPGGATIIPNHWYVESNMPMRKQSEHSSGRGIARDPEAYPDPHKFNPDRWLDEQGSFREDMSFCNYGFGRRCVWHQSPSKPIF